MSRRIEIYAGTAGHSAWFSEDRGETWLHPNSHSGMYLEARVWTFSSHPTRPDILHAGTDMGIYRWDESTTRWTEPRDVSPSEIAKYPSPSDPGGFAVVMSDGRIRRLSREEILESWAGAKAALRAAKGPGR